MSEQTWIEEIGAWREKVALAPDPFITPPITDSALYLVEEAGELLAAVHAASRSADLRNPQSSREQIADEIGDTMLMLGTVALQSGVTLLVYERSYYTGLTLAKRLLDNAISIENRIDGNLNSTYVQSALDLAYSKLVDLAGEVAVDPIDALRQTMRKIEARAGL
jgi:NTP pyrophosphatase (non-canonical NTP hydrolase)